MEPGEESPLLGRKNGGKKPAGLLRTVGVFTASAILFGNCVGAGIFISPRGVFEKTGSAGGGLMVWGFGGVIATLSTLAYADLGTMIPVGGGEFAYINQTYGKFLAFLFSFCMSFLVRPASMAVVAIVFSEYLSNLIWGHTLHMEMIRVIAVSLVAVAAVLNIFGVKIISLFINVASVVKFAAVAFLLVCGVAVAVRGEGHSENFMPNTTFTGGSSQPTDYANAFYFCLFSYQYWNAINYIYDELKNPEKTLPLSGFLGILGVSLSYTLANVAYLLIFPVSAIIATNTIAMESGYAAFGRAGEIIMSAGLLVSCAGCIGGSMLCISRNIQMTAQQEVFPLWMSWISPTFRTPVPAIITLAVAISTYLLFDVFQLIPFLGTVEWLFYNITFSIVLYLRFTQPNLHRPFKFPIVVTALLFVLSGVLVLLPLFSSTTRMTTLLGLCWLPLASLFYALRYIYTKYCCPTKPPSKGESVDSMDSGYNDKN